MTKTRKHFKELNYMRGNKISSLDKMTVEEAQNQVTQARQLLAQKRTEAEEVQRKLKEQEQSFPQPTQQRLRQGSFSGIQGLRRRQQVQSAIGQIKGQQQAVSGYQEDISKFEQEQIVPIEQQIQAAQHEEYAFNLAKEYKLEECIECGVCAYICPSKIPLLEMIQNGKRAFLKKTEPAPIPEYHDVELATHS